IRLTGTVNGKPREFTYEATFPKASGTHEAVPRLWAISKIGHLMDAIRLNGEKEELKKEIVALAKEFGVMTKYTSWLVLEDNARVFNDPAMDRRDGARRALREAAERVRQQNGDAPPPAAEWGARGEKAVEESREVQDAKEGKAQASEPAPGFVLDDAIAAGRHKDQGLRRKDAVQVVGGKTFYGASDGWYDEKWDGKQETLKVEYLSEEYFKLLAKSPELGKYLALGDHVVVVVDGKAYEITPAPK
ncbi:MAG: hypothetical protein HUU15_19175, partial [Candidatus Brocadiae bacterium]|nr:hypothetical protein [Candidatus Brocadiia bacterium]